MNFLDEVTYNIQPGEEVPNTVKPDDTVNIGDHSMEEKKGKDIDGDGDVDSDDYLAARDAAIKKAKSMKEGVAKDLEIKAMEASSLEEFLDDVYQDYPQHKGNFDIKDFLTKYYLNAGGPIDEGKLSKAAGYIAIMAALLGLNKATSERIYNSDPKIKAAIENYEKAKESGNKENMAKFEKEIKKRKLAWDAGKPMDEAKTIELPADTTFTVDLKHLMKKHMDEGKSKEDTIKFTKALMAKLHNKGEVTVDGTKIIFKEGKKKSGYMGYTEFAEADIPQDTQLALPEPDAQDFLGDDGMDYEGGMAKSQMLKMKKYAMALCDMVDDESQLEAWVQAKFTKASDYMSSVYHYLDYQKSKMNEAVGDVIPDGEWQKLDIEWIIDEPDVNRADYQEGPLYGTTEDGRAFESYGYWTPSEDEYTPLPDEEVKEVPLS